MSLEQFRALSRDLSKLLKEAYNHDVIIYVGVEPDIKTFKAHSGILRIRSPYFNTALSCQWVKKEGDAMVFNKPNISASVFGDILEYIYTGTMALSEKSGKQCLEILVAADELLMNELHDLMQSHLLEKHSLWLRKSFALVYRTAVRLDASKELQEFCKGILYTEPDVLLRAEDFTTLDQDTLEIVLEQRNFQMKEIQIWDHIIQWCMSKHPNVCSDVTKWTTNDFVEFEETLRQWIQFVRFCEINSKDFYQKVRPFKACFSQSLYEDLECFYYTGVQKESLTYLPNNAIRSSLINQEQISIISNWIDGGQIRNSNNYKYHFGLLLRGSIDGFSADEFHTKCDNKGPTLVLMRIKGTDHIIGGYNPTSWKSQTGWILTRDSFIFSLGYGKNPQPQWSRVLQPEKAIWNSFKNGPCFGDGDLWCVENLCEDELCSSESKSYRQGICDAIIKSMKGNVSSSEQEWSSTSLDLGASFSTTRNPFVWRTDFTNNHNKSSSLIGNISYGPTRFSVNEYEVFCVSKTDIADVPINSKKFRRGKKRLTLVEKYHTPMDKEGWWECD